MRVPRAFERNDAAQLLDGEVGHHRRGHPFGHQHHVVRRRRSFAADILQVRQYPFAEFAHVLGTLAQVGVLHPFEGRRLFEDRLLERPLRPLAATDALADVARQRGVVEHVQVGVEELAFLRAEGFRHLLVDALDVGPRAADGLIEEC